MTTIRAEIAGGLNEDFQVHVAMAPQIKIETATSGSHNEYRYISDTKKPSMLPIIDPMTIGFIKANIPPQGRGASPRPLGGLLFCAFILVLLFRRVSRQPPPVAAALAQNLCLGF